MAFVRIEDPTSTLEMVVFPKTYIKVRDKLLPEAFVLVTGKVSVRKREESETQEWSVLVDSLISFVETDIPDLARMLTAGDWQEDVAKRQVVDSTPKIQTLNSVKKSEGLNIVVPDKPSNDLIMKLRDVLKATPGTTRVYLVVNSGGEDKKIATEYSVLATRDTIGKIAAVVGENNVRY
jgi:DNA polymerase III alpha subunit